MFQLKKLLFVFVSLISSFAIHAQTNQKSLKSEAFEYYRIREYHNALPLLLKMDSTKHDHGELSYKIAVCYFNSENKFSALPYFEKAKRLMHKHHELDLMLAKIYQLHHDFDKAIEYYNHHKKYINTKSEEGAAELVEIDNAIAQCNTGKELISKPLDYEIVNLGEAINSKFRDYAPVISADETVLIFTSRRDNSTGGQVDDQDGKYYEDVYISKKEDGKWSQAQNMGKTINTDDHDACIGLSPDGQKMFIYKSQPGVRLAGDIYVSDLKGNDWTKPSKLGSNINTPYWESHASISADEQTMYFTSDKPGGEGKKDIYVSNRLINGEWGPAKDLSPKINTKYDEDGPFLHPDGKTLYFSSKGHNSMGGYDVFKTVYDENTKDWSEPENIGYPINTAGDELFFVWSADGTRAYFSSARPDSYGDKDIYMAKKKVVSNYVVLLKGKVIDKVTRKPVAATINVHNLTTNEMVGIFNSNSATGKYIVVLPVGKDFSVTAEAPGYVFSSEHVNVVENDKFVEIEQNIELVPVGTKDNVTKLNNVFFDYDKSTLRPQSILELNKLVKLLQENKGLYVEIASHTDSVANNVYNMYLSRERAKSVVKYLISNGIDSTKLLPMGYGEDFNIASNSTSEGRQLNRRSEFIFTEKFDIRNKSKNMENGYYYRVERDSLSKIVTEKEKQIDKISESNDAEKQILVLHDSKYKIRIYFGSKNYTISDSTHRELNDFVKLIKENKIQVFVTGHCDKHTAHTVGIDLTKKRMDNVVKYLVKRGISELMITKEYDADKKPHASDLSSEGRQLNRRVEVKIKIRE